MKEQLKKELKELETAYKSGKSGLTTNEYCSQLHYLLQKIKKAS
jgi:hypothetical protein